MRPRTGVPAHAWVGLVVAICGVSSAGAIFSLMKEVPPLLRASWRMWATSAMLCLPALREYSRLDDRQRGRCARNLSVLGLSGVFLALHFGCWVWSLDLTSLTHSLLWVTAHPIVITAAAWLWFLSSLLQARALDRSTVRGGGTKAVVLPLPSSPLPLNAAATASAAVPPSALDTPSPCPVNAQGASISSSGPRAARAAAAAVATRPTLLESCGAMIGFGGGVLMVVGAEDGEGVTVVGDALAFLGAVAMAVYLLCGRRLRAWMPVFVYAFPVTLLSALLLSAVALVAEGATFSFADPRVAVFGWLASPKYLLYVCLMGAIAGIAGHTMLNYVLRHIPTLVVSVALLMEPLVGSAIGALLGVQDAPGLWTWLGGPVLLAGATMVTFGQRGDRQGEHVQGEAKPVDGVAESNHTCV